MAKPAKHKTMPSCKDYVDQIVTLDEEWIAESEQLQNDQAAYDTAYDLYWERRKELLELAGGHPTGAKPRRRPCSS